MKVSFFSLVNKKLVDIEEVFRDFIVPVFEVQVLSLFFLLRLNTGL